MAPVHAGVCALLPQAAETYTRTIMKPNDRAQWAELLGEKHRQGGLMPDEGHVRMLVAMKGLAWTQLSTKSDAYHR
jgi:hypothetical protein